MCVGFGTVKRFSLFSSVPDVILYFFLSENFGDLTRIWAYRSNTDYRLKKI